MWQGSASTTSERGHRPEEGVVVDAVFPQLLAAIVGVHVKPNCILFPRLLVWPQLDEEPSTLERDLANVYPTKNHIMLNHERQSIHTLEFISYMRQVYEFYEYMFYETSL